MQPPQSYCTCGRHHPHHDDSTSRTGTDLVPPLDASFVQVLSTPTTDDTEDDSCLNLSQAVASPMNPPPLCWNCIQRVERALDNDTTRLENECFAYQDAIRQDQQRKRGLRQATTTATATAQQAFRDEIRSLEDACRLGQMELDRLDELLREQLLLKLELDAAITEASEERNLLIWDAKNFDEDQVQLTREVTSMQSVEQQLLSFQLTGTAIKLMVDTDRGLRYPLINGLRLAYRPKGDLEWTEVQTAWALAGQLLYMIGNIFAVTGQQWKLVPLSDCAKLFYYPKAKADGTQPPSVIFDLGHPSANGTKALLTWNAALSQTIVRARGVLAETFGPTPTGGRALPYEITPTTIGNMVLPKLDADDDSNWARMIHCMASNLLWLSENADAYLQETVGTMALVHLHGAATGLTNDEQGNLIVDD